MQREKNFPFQLPAALYSTETAHTDNGATQREWLCMLAGGAPLRLWGVPSLNFLSVFRQATQSLPYLKPKRNTREKERAAGNNKVRSMLPCPALKTLEKAVEITKKSQVKIGHTFCPFKGQNDLACCRGWISSARLMLQRGNVPMLDRRNG